MSGLSEIWSKQDWQTEAFRQQGIASRLAGELAEANKLLEQTIEVLQGLATAIDFYFVHEDGEGERRSRELYEARQSAHALLDNLKALKKEGTE